MSEENKGIEVVAVALSIQATEDSYGVGLRVHECFSLVDSDAKVEIVSHWMMLLNELRKDLITEMSDQTVIH